MQYNSAASANTKTTGVKPNRTDNNVTSADNKTAGIKSNSKVDIHRGYVSMIISALGFDGIITLCRFMF